MTPNTLVPPVQCLLISFLPKPSQRTTINVSRAIFCTVEPRVEKNRHHHTEPFLSVIFLELFRCWPHTTWAETGCALSLETPPCNFHKGSSGASASNFPISSGCMEQQWDQCMRTSVVCQSLGLPWPSIPPALSHQ